MKRIVHWSFIITIFLAACNLSDAGKTSAPEPTTPLPTQAATPTQAPVNLALGKTVTAANSTADSPPQNAVDGNPETIWNSGDDQPQWILIDLGKPASIEHIRLLAAQDPAGTTNHQMLAGTAESNLSLIHEFNGATADGDLLELVPDEPLTGIRYIQISTNESPSWVAWREIEIIGREGGLPAITQTGGQSAEIIYYHGTVLTMEMDRPQAEAIAIAGDKILAVGSEAEVLTLQREGTRLVDLEGRTLTPGFIDSHAHRIGDRWHFGDVSAEEMMAKALSQGWTSIHELFVTDQRLNELAAIDRANGMLMRVSMYLTMNFEYTADSWWQAYQPLQQYSPYLQIAGLKITLDREWGEQLFFDQDQYTRMVLDGTGRGWQIATHSFSPAANQIVLNGYEAGLGGAGNETLRLRLEHIGTITDDELQKMAELGIIGSVGLINAGNLPEDSSFKKYIPQNEVEHTARWRDLLNAGVFLIGNTDDPWCCTDWRNNYQAPAHAATVVDAIYQGVTFNTFNGRQPEAWQRAQALTVLEALELLTINGAYAAHQEGMLGSLRAGKLADLVILSANPLVVPVEQIKDIQVLMTLVGGEVRYCTQDQETLCEK